VTLTVDIFGHNSEVFGFHVKIHSARGLQRDRKAGSRNCPGTVRG
jgi:hypothetical protein